LQAIQGIYEKFMSVLSQLNPGPVWKYFEEICKVPRLSKNEGRIIQYLLEFAAKNGLEVKQDEVGNILIIKPAYTGKEGKRTLVLQSHMDMVGEKNADYPHDWNNDPIVPLLNDDWVKAKGTTLGADDGMGIAAQLAILTDKNLKSCKIECLFTVDEESGMTGAINLKPDFFEGRTLINLDSEDEGILFIGCAGGTDTVGVMEYERVPAGDNKSALLISLTGLHGGHSGDEIHKGYANSVKLMNRLLQNISGEYDFGLADFDGGNLRNAIPRESFTKIVTDNRNIQGIKQIITAFESKIREEFISLEQEMKVSVKECDLPDTVIDNNSKERLISLLNSCPHGVIAWSKEMEDLVETSTNLASVKFEDNNTISIVTTQRSSVEASKNEVAELIESCMRNAGAEVTHSGGYPGWKPNLNSEILNIARESYSGLFGSEPQVKAIHAGLECGLIYKNFKGIDMISFGPTIKGAHTPGEMVEIATVSKFWDLLIDVINKFSL
jgi:dipeptidase D